MLPGNLTLIIRRLEIIRHHEIWLEISDAWEPLGTWKSSDTWEPSGLGVIRHLGIIRHLEIIWKSSDVRIIWRLDVIRLEIPRCLHIMRRFESA